MSRPISLVLVDDSPPAGDGIVALLRAEPGFRVLAASADIQEALRRIRETTPDIVLLHLPVRHDDRLTLAGALHGEVPESRVIVMGLAPLNVDVTSLVRAGVSGFLMAGAPFDEFLRTIHSVADGVQVLPLQLTRSLFGQLNRHGAPPDSKRVRHSGRLTGPERDVADLMVRGMSHQAIASRLQVALHTVGRHAHSVLSKLVVNGRLEVAAVRQAGMAPTPASDPTGNGASALGSISADSVPFA